MLCGDNALNGGTMAILPHGAELGLVIEMHHLAVASIPSVWQGGACFKTALTYSVHRAAEVFCDSLIYVLAGASTRLWE